MVSKEKAFKASAVSALMIGAAHYFAHQYFSSYPIGQQVMYVGVAVVASAFLIAYFGMVGWK